MAGFVRLELVVFSRASSRTDALPQWSVVKHRLANDANPCGSAPARDGALKITINGVDTHHRDDCLPLKNRQAQDQPIPRQKPTPEGKIMLIHLLTCLALTAVTLTVFSYIVLAKERRS